MKKLCQVVLILMFLGIGTAAAQDPAHYLALGDSISFGYNPFVPLTTPNLLHYYHGYPQFVSAFLSLDLANASCPGQTSSSFLSLSLFVPDNGCDQWRIQGLPLFVTYASSETQEQYAISFLAAHPDTRLVTITIGGDDLLYLAKTTCAESESCITANLPGVLATFTTNLNEIYKAVRSTGYEGPIVAINYPSPDYNNAFETGGLSELNLVISNVTKLFNGRVADAFSIFKLASVVSGGLPCFVGLLFFNPSGQGCDVHPTPLGQLLMGQLALQALQPEDRWKEESLFFGINRDTR
jgi:lysophospholipase L1-like esterase